MADRSLLRVYLNRRAAVLVGLGFSSGLAGKWGLLGTPVQKWLLESGVSVETVGLFELAALPFAFNFMAGPVLDRFEPPMFRGLGRRRGWLLLIQMLLVLAIGALALTPGQGQGMLGYLTVAAVSVAALAAVQDVLSDAYRTDVLPDEELGAGAAVHVNGYRLAMLLASAGGLALAGTIGWRGVMLAMAALMGVGIVATLFAPTPPSAHEHPATLRAAVTEPFGDFFGRFGWRAIVLLAVIVLFKLPDFLAGAMTVPLLDHLGFSNTQIALVRETPRLIVTVVGALVGGLLVARLGTLKSLWTLVVIQALSNLGFTLLAGVGSANLYLMGAVVCVESFCGGMVTVGFVALLMSLCTRRYSATQYALFTSLNFLTGTIASAPTGHLVGSIGYASFFALTAATAIPVLALLPLLKHVSRGDGDDDGQKAAPEPTAATSA